MTAFMGSHGTCMSMAIQIKRDGFLTKPGRIGQGAYFWTAVTEDHLCISTHYAIEWAKRAREKFKAYSDYEDQSLAVVQTTVEVEDEEILYLDDPDYHLELHELLSKVAVEKFGLSSIFDLKRAQLREIEATLYGIIEQFIKDYENELGETVKLVFKSQKPAGNDSLIELIGNASCFAVRDTSCISDLHISPIEEGT